MLLRGPICDDVRCLVLAKHIRGNVNAQVMVSDPDDDIYERPVFDEQTVVRSTGP